jgi:ribosome-associated protein
LAHHILLKERLSLAGTAFGTVFRTWPPSSRTGREPNPRSRALSRKPSVVSSSLANAPDDQPLLARILSALDDDKAEDIVTIPLTGRSSLTDAIVVATGRSSRHVASLAENLARRLKEWGFSRAHIEGLPQGDWVLIDAGDVIVHLFREEVRAYYDLEGMWSVDEKKPARARAESAGSAA